MNVELDIEDNEFYWKRCLPYLETRGEISCAVIQRITNTTNPQKVIEKYKKMGLIDRFEWKSKNGKSWKVHYLKEQTELAL